ncbi:protein BTG2 isoform X2 [Aethina tumida]|uniref:protein BTG2 isoform X2 n=1 Tax=Aethina tumida TaxID=116153 RepID=UPI00096B2B80|nr:protein BTG2 isoform X2 [Aethina tumida]
MKEEILAAVMFFIRFIEKNGTITRDQLDNFKKHLTDLLEARFDKHWFPDVPTKGQGYRCIRVNGVSPVDLTLEKAAVKCGLSYSDLRLPQELTVWVDPSEVCYRLGESEGSYCTLATFPSESSSSSASSSSESTSSTPTPSPPSTPLQDKPKKVQKHMHQRYPLDYYPVKYRNHSNMAVPSLRVKQSPREAHTDRLTETVNDTLAVMA